MEYGQLFVRYKVDGAWGRAYFNKVPAESESGLHGLYREILNQGNEALVLNRSTRTITWLQRTPERFISKSYGSTSSPEAEDEFNAISGSWTPDFRFL